MFCLLVCLSECKYLLFPCVSDTLAGDFLSAQLIYRGKFELCHPLYDFRGKNEMIFRGCCRPRLLKSAKIIPHVFETKPRKFGDAKISHCTLFTIDEMLFFLLLYTDDAVAFANSPEAL